VTIIVGVKCSDGVVIGADSVATSSTGAQNVMQIESNDKLKIFGGKVIVGASGFYLICRRVSLLAIRKWVYDSVPCWPLKYLEILV
jgi:20S proteasome alpha/beta subunit